jgi:hypothetical protein
VTFTTRKWSRLVCVSYSVPIYSQRPQAYFGLPQFPLRSMAQRFAKPAAKAARALTKSAEKDGPFRVLVSGASGMVGQALQHSLAVPKPVNHFQPEVHTLVRHRPRASNEIYWDPYEGDIEIEKLEGFDAVVHLAGR